MSGARHKTSKNPVKAPAPLRRCSPAWRRGCSQREILRGLRVSCPKSGQASKEDTSGRVFLAKHPAFLEKMPFFLRGWRGVGGLPAEELGVWQDVLQPVVVQHAEGEHRRSGVVGKVSGDARWKRQHHFPRDLHDTPAGPDTETEGGGKRGGGCSKCSRRGGFVPGMGQ